MRVALLSANAQRGDAIGNNVAAKFSFCERAADVRAFVQSDHRLHPTLAEHYCVAAGFDLPDDDWKFLSSADLVCVEFGQYYPLLSLLPLLAGAKTRIMIDYHGITPPKLWGGHNREALVQGMQHRGLAWLADATITHSAFTHKELADLTHLPAERLPRLGFPVDCSWFAAGPTANECRRCLGLDGKRVLLYVGRMAPNKQPVLLVEALQHLLDLSPAVHAVFVGDCSDLYAAEVERCLESARQLGLSDRVHFAGPQHGTKLRDYYRAAEVFVVPSQWESFCIPVIEAMAAGLPVVAARCTALPETISSAGLSFIPGDATDLARQLRRVLQSDDRSTKVSNGQPERRPRIAVIASRFGVDFASGAESSLRRMAHALHSAGCPMEVFTSTTRSETGRTSDFAVGTSFDDGIAVHRFDQARILDALCEREESFDYLLTGPYLSKLTTEVAARWPNKSIVVPCFHDEPDVHRDCWADRYDRVAGIIYHSTEEKALAESVLGFNHPGATVIDTHVDLTKSGDVWRGQRFVGAEQYVVYSGRYVDGKNLPLLLEYAGRFDAENPDLLRFVFTGQGEFSIPREPWAVDLGFVASDTLRNVLAGAKALVQLSCNESLSLVALESWAQGTPVIAHRRCEVLKGHMERSGGGLLVESYEEFSAALRSLVCESNALGLAGQAYVRQKYGCPDAFRQQLLTALKELELPLRERMRRRGQERAFAFDKSIWRQQFSALVENVIHAEPLAGRQHIVVKSRETSGRTMPSGKSVLLPVRIANEGTLPAVAEGPARTVLAGVITDEVGEIVRNLAPTSLPSLIMPGQATAASVMLAVPEKPGQYAVRLWAARVDRPEQLLGPEVSIPLIVQGDGLGSTRDGNGVSFILDEARAALVEAHRLQRLPDEYNDVTQGLFAGLKQRIKKKLLGNFKKAYVDVMSRQQSACNKQLVMAVQTLTECCATLDHAVRILQERVANLEAGSAEKTARLTDQTVHESSPKQPIP